MILDHAEVLVVGSAATEIVDAIGRRSPDQFVIDLVRLPDAQNLRNGGKYRAVAW